MRCSYCGSDKHPFEFCPKNANQSNRLHLRCSYCGSNKHNYEACPKLGSPRKGGIKLED